MRFSVAQLGRRVDWSRKARRPARYPRWVDRRSNDPARRLAVPLRSR